MINTMTGELLVKAIWFVIAILATEYLFNASVASYLRLRDLTFWESVALVTLIAILGKL